MLKLIKLLLSKGQATLNQKNKKQTKNMRSFQIATCFFPSSCQKCTSSETWTFLNTIPFPTDTGIKIPFLEDAKDERQL